MRVRCAGLPVVIRTREMPDEHDVEVPCGWEGPVIHLACPECGGTVEPAPAGTPAQVAGVQADADALLIVGFYAREHAHQGSPLAIAADRVIALGRRAKSDPTTPAPGGQMKEEPCGA